MDLPTYHAFSQLLKKSGSDAVPSEVQGTLMGLLSGNPRMDKTTTLHTVIEALAPGKKPGADLNRAIEAVLEQSEEILRCNQLLSEASFDFPLLVPSKGSVALHAEALSAWCKGFLYGLGLSGADVDACSADAKEALRDITQIAALPKIAEDSVSEEEMQYVESIHDYLQVAALLVAADLKR